MNYKTHKLYNESHWVSRLRENLTSGSEGEGLETGHLAPRQSFTRQVFFKECKQYLRLGLCQNTDFNGQIADTTLTFITYTVLNLQRRFEAYETIGELFRVSQQYLMELTLWERILEIFIKMLQQLMEVLPIDLEETLEKLFHDHKRGKKLLAIMNALSEDDENHEKTIKIAA
jgi:RNA-splicing ligase RtcB